MEISAPVNASLATFFRFGSVESLSFFITIKTWWLRTAKKAVFSFSRSSNHNVLRWNKFKLWTRRSYTVLFVCGWVTVTKWFIVGGVFPWKAFLLLFFFYNYNLYALCLYWRSILIVMRFKNEPLARIGRSNPIPRIDVNKLIDWLRPEWRGWTILVRSSWLYCRSVIASDAITQTW